MACTDMHLDLVELYRVCVGQCHRVWRAASQVSASQVSAETANKHVDADVEGMVTLSGYTVATFGTAQAAAFKAI